MATLILTEGELLLLYRVLAEKTNRERVTMNQAPSAELQELKSLIASAHDQEVIRKKAAERAAMFSPIEKTKIAARNF
jgi:hypothetical protein